MNTVFRFRPEPTKGNLTFEALYGVQKDEMEEVNSNVTQVFLNNFIRNADLKGVEMFERMYRIKADESLTLEERREIVYNKMTFKSPFTRQRLDYLLTNIFGKNTYSYSVDPKTLVLRINVPNKISNKVYNRYIRDLRNIIPANVYIILATPYTYIYLGTFTYEQLQAYTYYELSQYSTYVTTKDVFVIGEVGDPLNFGDTVLYDEGEESSFYVC